MCLVSYQFYIVDGSYDEFKTEHGEKPVKLLDDLFRKTKALPPLYWLPLTDEEVSDSKIEIIK